MVEPITINLRYLAQEISLPEEQVERTIELLDAGFPVSFIARYRKDETKNLHEDELRRVESKLKSARLLAERKMTILKTLDSQGKLNEDLDKKIRDARSLRRLEDLFLSFKPKKKSLASEAQAAGLEPIALEILEGTISPEKLDERASEFVNADKNVKTIADVLLGAAHIIAEIFATKAELLQHTRENLHSFGSLVTKKIQPVAEPAKKEKKEPAVEKVSQSVPVGAQDSAPTEIANTVAEDIVESVPAGAHDSAPTEIVNTVAEDIVEEIVESVSAGAQDSAPTEITNTVAEDVVEEIVESVSVGAQDSTPTEVTEITATTSEELSSDKLSSGAPLDEVAQITAEFQKLQEAHQAEKGTPVVISQNTLKKRKKEETKQKVKDAKQRQREYVEKQFAEYFDFSTRLRGVQAYRILAFNRAESNKIISVLIETDEEKMLDAVKKCCVPAEHVHSEFLTGCLKDALHRIVVPALKREIRNEMTEYAEALEIRACEKRIKYLLTPPPVRGKRVLAIDSSPKHGSKLVALDEFGNILGFEAIVMLGGDEARKQKGVEKVIEMIRRFKSDLIAVGNGSGGGEIATRAIESAFADSDLSFVMMNKIGASAYANSPIAKEELPNYDPLLREAISLGRRLQDPLAELVKISPQNLGQGASRNEIKNKHLLGDLTNTVSSCVNHTGVNLNTASPMLLSYVAGLNLMTAQRIVEYRREHGAFRSREDLKKVSGFSEAMFAHSAGFLFIPDAVNPLDATRIHPESYGLAAKVLETFGFCVEDLQSREKVRELIDCIAKEKFGELTIALAEELNVGLYTVRDILDELRHPAHDSRKLSQSIFRKTVLKVQDLSAGMELFGTIQNVVSFGAFVDIGLRESGFVHISEMATGYLRDAHDRVSVGDMVKLWVVEIDAQRKRITCSMLPPGTERAKPSEYKERPARREGQEDHRQPKRENPSGNAVNERQPLRADYQQRDDRQPQREHSNFKGNFKGKKQQQDTNRTPKIYTSAPTQKEAKPITEKMKEGKEPMRSFGDLAQLFGRVSVSNEKDDKQ